MSTRKQRSRDGCWTCKDRRRKCDGKRPHCQNCEDRTIQCEGYNVRLQWGIGIASRGRFTGADEPVIGSVPARPAGRQRDRERERERKRYQNAVEDRSRQSHQSEAVSGGSYSLMSIEDSHDRGHGSEIDLERLEVQDPVLEAHLSKIIDDEQLFEHFLTSGIHVLHSTTVDDEDQMLASRLPTLCTQSKALYAVCLAFQTSLSDEYKSRFFEYFDAALGAFRVELDASASYLADATWAAGLLLCSVGFFHGLPWTIHLQGMYAILKTHGFDDSSGQPNPFRAHLLEVMGVMDLPSFAVGRQNHCIGIWRRHCRGNLFHRYPNRDSIEHVSGLPRSLLDIYSGIGEESKEQDFWDWPGSTGTFLQCQLWEAYRLAGMLTIRHRSLPLAHGPAASIASSTPITVDLSARTVPSTEILVTRILSHIQAIVKISEAQESTKDELVVNAINYPTFVAGLESSLIKSNEEWRAFVTSCFTLPYLAKSHGMENKYLIELLEQFWQYDDEAPNVDELARAYGRELGLL